MGLWGSRADEIDGGESVRMYYDYLVSGRDDLKQKILLHNHDDVLQLYRLLAVTGRTDMHGAMRKLGFPVATAHGIFVISETDIKGDLLTIKGSQPAGAISYRYPADGYLSFEFDPKGSFTIETLMERHHELTLADLTKLPVDKTAFGHLPTYGSGYLITCQGAQGRKKGSENDMEINLLAQQMVRGIVSRI
jgi:hypothetical protein